MATSKTSTEYSTMVEVYDDPAFVESIDDTSNLTEQSTTPVVRLPFSTLEKYIDAIVDHKLQNILNNPRVVDDKIATNEIKKFIQQQKEKGVQQLDVYQIATSVNIPVLQVEKILDLYIKKGFIKEIDE